MKKWLLFLVPLILLTVGCNAKTLSFFGESDNWTGEYSDEIITILAVTGGLGTGASQVEEDSKWTASIDLVAWRPYEQNASVQKEEVRLEWLVNEDDLETAIDLLGANQIVKLQVSPSKATNDSMLLVEVLETNVPDNELEVILNEELKPVSYQDDQFGTLQLDKSIMIFQTDVQWNQKSSQLSFDCHEDDKVMHSSLHTARILFEKQEDWDLKIKTFASEKLLDLANEWLADNNETNLTEITKELFIERMTIESIHVSPEGRFEFYFSDGDLFWGHSISVIGNVNGKFEDATI